MRRFIVTQLPWIAIMTAVTIQSSFAGIRIPAGIQFSDKILHFIVFGILGWFLARGLYYSRIKILKTHFVIAACIIGLIFAFSDELHQSFVPGRSAEFLDWTADGLGIFVFSILYYLFSRSRKADQTKVKADEELSQAAAD
jgi:VanZ family protein